MNKILVIGLIEDIKINGNEVKAKIDTGADRSSICRSLITKLNLTRIGKNRTIRSSTGTEKREVYIAKVEIKGKIFESEFTLAKREHLNYSVLIGNDILKKGFLVNPLK